MCNHGDSVIKWSFLTPKNNHKGQDLSNKTDNYRFLRLFWKDKNKLLYSMSSNKCPSPFSLEKWPKLSLDHQLCCLLPKFCFKNVIYRNCKIGCYGMFISKSTRVCIFHGFKHKVCYCTSIFYYLCNSYTMVCPPV